MGLEEYKGVYIYAQQVDNKLSDIAFELVGKAKELAADLNTEVTAVLLGSNVKALATELGEYGADKVIVVDNPELETYRTEPYAQALVSVINEYKPEIMLVGATAIGRDLGPTVSARVKTGLTADCTKLEIGDFPINAMPGQEQKHNQLLMTRPAFGGNTIATIACPDNRPQMATVRPGVMQKLPKEAGRAAEVIEYNPALEENNRYVEIMDIVKAVGNVENIMDAKVLVSGGRGVGSAENFEMLRDLASCFKGGMVSCSRAAVENGWLAQDYQVGQTLWVILLIRLLFPVSIYTEYGILYSETFVEKNENLSAQEMKSDNSLQIFPKDENTSKPYMGKKKNINILMILWYIGLLVFAVYYIIQRIAVCRRTKNAKKISSQDEIYEWKESMACVIGLVKPKYFCHLT